MKTQEGQNTKSVCWDGEHMNWKLEVFPTGDGELSMQVVAPPDQRATAEAVAEQFHSFFNRCIRLDEAISNFR